MKPFTRIVAKHGHEEWPVKLQKIGDGREIIVRIITGQIPELKGVPFAYSNYHGVGQLETPYFLVQIGTFPVKIEEELITSGHEVK